MMLDYRIDQLFSEIDFFLEKETDENSAYLVINSLSCIASQFNKDQICEAKIFQYRWEEVKEKLKSLALTSDFEKNSQEIEQKLEEVLEPEKWQDKADFRRNGSIEREIEKAQSFFILMTS